MHALLGLGLHQLHCGSWSPSSLCARPCRGAAQCCQGMHSGLQASCINELLWMSIGTPEKDPLLRSPEVEDPFSLACAATVMLGQTMIGFRLPGLSSCLTREAADDVQTQNNVLKALLPRWQRRQILQSQHMVAQIPIPSL